MELIFNEYQKVVYIDGSLLFKDEEIYRVLLFYGQESARINRTLMSLLTDEMIERMKNELYDFRILYDKHLIIIERI